MAGAQPIAAVSGASGPGTVVVVAGPSGTVVEVAGGAVVSVVDGAGTVVLVVLVDGDGAVVVVVRDGRCGTVVGGGGVTRVVVGGACRPGPGDGGDGADAEPPVGVPPDEGRSDRGDVGLGAGVGSRGGRPIDGISVTSPFSYISVRSSTTRTYSSALL